METTLLRTKLYIPQPRSNLVPRPRLIEQLNKGLRCKLTLISAPAGFGKTTLLSEWAHRLGRQAGRDAAEKLTSAPVPVAWLSLDDGDNDPVRFLTYFVTALQTVAADLGEGVLGVLQSPSLALTPASPALESILMTLINDIVDIPDHFAFILDDYQVIDAQAIDETLTFLLDHLPPQMHLIIASRTDPSWPLSRLRGRNQMVEIREHDLRFMRDEVAVFLEIVMGLSLSSEDVAVLETRTEGWIAGLQLAVLAMQAHKLPQSSRFSQKWDRAYVTHFINSFSGSNRYIFDYLADEVLRQRPPGTKEFLLQTSILDHMTADLCDAVRSVETVARSGGSAGTERCSVDSQSILEALEAANLFIVPLDDERRWYRYHHLFAHLLRQQLRREQPERVPMLHRRASEWFELQALGGGQSLEVSRLLEEAVKHALAAEDFEHAANLIEKLAEVLWDRGEPTALLRWLAALPDEQVAARPSLCNFYAWLLFLNGQNQIAEAKLQVAERALDMAVADASDTSSHGQRCLNADKLEQKGRAAAIRASIAFRQGDGPGIFRFAHQALEYLSEKSLMWRCIAAMPLGYAQDFGGDTAAASQTLSEAVAMSKASGNIYLIMSTSLHLGTILMQQGRLKQAYRLCQDLLQLAEERRVQHTEMAGCLYDELGLILCEWNNLAKAMDYLQKGAELSEQGSDVGVRGWSYLTMLRALFTQGDLTGAEAIIHKMDKLEHEADVPPWYTSPKEAWRVRLWLRQGDLISVTRWVQDRELNPSDELPYLREKEYVGLARILVAQDRLEEALNLLERLRKAAEVGGRIGSVIEMLSIETLAHRARGEDEAALTALERALSLAEPGGYVRLFVDEGQPMAALLYEVATRGTVQDYARRLLAAFPVVEPESSGRTKTRSAQPEMVEPLSEREVEVLQLISEGLTNQEVAARLFLTLNTVKAHAHNIFGKLNVNNRTQAVARARGLGLLPSTKERIS